MYIIQKNLEALLLANWATFIDRNKLFLKILEDTRDAALPKKWEKDVPSSTTKFSLTQMIPRGNTGFEIIIEFTIPKDDGVAIGAHVYLLKLNGELYLENSYGMCFLPLLPNLDPL